MLHCDRRRALRIGCPREVDEPGVSLGQEPHILGTLHQLVGVSENRRSQAVIRRGAIDVRHDIQRLPHRASGRLSGGVGRLGFVLRSQAPSQRHDLCGGRGRPVSRCRYCRRQQVRRLAVAGGVGSRRIDPGNRDAHSKVTVEETELE